MITDAKLPELPEWLQERYPFHTRTLQVGPCKMSFVDEGPVDAPVLLLLHGNPTWSFLFRDLISRAMPDHRVIAPDHVGFGLSDKPRDPAYHRLSRHIDNVKNLVDALKLRDITLVAHGWGGPIGMGYAVEDAENIARMVLCCTWPLPVANSNNIKQPLRLRIAASGRLGRFLDSLLNLSLTSAVTSRTYVTPSDWTVEAYTYPFPSMASRTAITAFSQMFYETPDADRAVMTNTYEGLNRITAPAEILVGESDPLMTRLPAYLLRDALPNARNPVVALNTSHLLPEDAPDFFADIVLRGRTESPASEGPASVFKILS